MNTKKKKTESVLLLESLHQDLKGFSEMSFLTPDVKKGIDMAIVQVERYMRDELKLRDNRIAGGARNIPKANSDPFERIFKLGIDVPTPSSSSDCNP